MALACFCFLVGSPTGASDRSDALYERALARRAADDYAGAITLLEQAIHLEPGQERYHGVLGETLGWAGRFKEAEEIYRRGLNRFPESRSLQLGLARVRLWMGRHGRAAEDFRTLLTSNPRDREALEGLAQAEYWSGDYRDAKRLFQRLRDIAPDSEVAAGSLKEIASASRPGYELSFSHSSDDQPYLVNRVQTTASVFSDPLTRWDGSIGTMQLQANRSADAHFASLGVVTKWHGIGLEAGAKALRFPDEHHGLLGHFALFRERLWSGTGRLFWHQRELLATAEAIEHHPSVSALGLRWERITEPLAAVSVEAQRFFDGNEGLGASAFYLAPLGHVGRVKLSAGIAAAYREVRESRFEITEVRSQQEMAAFRYVYTGAYDSYWTPHHLIEARLILAGESADAKGRRLKIQFDGGMAQDRARGFGPTVGITPFPLEIFSFFFDREYHPWQAMVEGSWPLAAAMRLNLSYRHTVTVFYRADEYQASLAGRY